MILLQPYFEKVHHTLRTISIRAHVSILCYMNRKSMHLELLVKIEAKCHEWEKFWVLPNAHIASMIETEKRNYHMSTLGFSSVRPLPIGLQPTAERWSKRKRKERGRAHA